MKYKARIGAQFGDDKAQIYGEELERIQKKNGGILTPQIIVEEAKNKKSPIHNYFEWDKDKAHKKFLLHQARMLIGTIEVIVNFNGEEKAIRRYLNVTSESLGEETTRDYMVIEKVLSDKELKNQILEQAIAEIDYWKEKYKIYKELSPIFASIELTKKRIHVFA